MKFLNYLKPRLCHLKNDGTITQIAGGQGMPIQVIPRSQTSFSRITLPDSAWRSQKAAKMHAHQTSAYDDIRMRLVPDQNTPKDAGNSATIWVWNNQPYQDIQKNLYAPAMIPESLAYKPLRDGVRLVQCLEGFEGQVWQDNALHASRWWPQPPNDQDWKIFLRNARMALSGPTAKRPDPTPGEWREFLFPIDLDTENLRTTFSPYRVGLMVGLIALLCISIQTTRIIGYSLKTSSMNAAYTEFLKDNQSAMRERQAAMRTLAQIEARKKAEPTARIADIVTDFLTLIPAKDLKINSMTIANGDLQMQADIINGVNTVDLVANLEGSQLLKDVNVEPNEQRRLITFNAKTTALIPHSTAEE